MVPKSETAKCWYCGGSLFEEVQFGHNDPGSQCVRCGATTLPGETITKLHARAVAMDLRPKAAPAPDPIPTPVARRKRQKKAMTP